MRLVLPTLALHAFGTLTRAQVNDGSTWTDSSGNTATVDVVDADPSTNAVTVTVTDATGFTPPANGTAASGSTADKPKAQSTGANTMETNSPSPNTYRVRDGKLQKKVNGRWVNMTKTKKKRAVRQTLEHLAPIDVLQHRDRGARSSRSSPDPTVGSIPSRPLMTGEEGTSLPEGPP